MVVEVFNLNNPGKNVILRNFISPLSSVSEPVF